MSNTTESKSTQSHAIHIKQPIDLETTDEEVVLDIQQVYDLAMYMKSIAIGNKEEYFANKFPNFKERCPQLYTKACDNAFEMSRFRSDMNLMLTQWKNYRDGNVSYKDASGKISTIMFHKSGGKNVKK